MAKRIVAFEFRQDDGVYNLIGIRCDDTETDPEPVPLAGAMIGTVVPTVIAAANLPAYLLFCDGSTYNRVDYPDLYALLDSAFITDADHFTTPDLRGRTVIGANGTYAVGSSGGESTHTLTSTEMPSHTHTQDSHNHTQNSHNHTQNSHGHTGNSHGHSINDPGHNHTQNQHNHGVTDPGHTHIIATKQTSTAGTATQVMEGSATGGINTRNSGSSTTGISTNNTTPTNNSATTGIAIDNSVISVQDATATNQSATATNNATTATNQNTGGGGSHNNLQPYSALNYAIVAKAG